MNSLYSQTARLILLFISVSILTFGCESEDKCDSVECLNGGICIEGICACPAGYLGENCETLACDLVQCENGGECHNGECYCPYLYEGEFCEIEAKAKFLGNYSGNFSCIPGINTDEMQIIEQPGIDGFSLLIGPQLLGICTLNENTQFYGQFDVFEVSPGTYVWGQFMGEFLDEDTLLLSFYLDYNDTINSGIIRSKECLEIIVKRI